MVPLPVTGQRQAAWPLPDKQIHIHRFGNERDVCTCRRSTIMLTINHIHHSLKSSLRDPIPPVVPNLKFPELNKLRKTVMQIAKSILVFQRPIEIVHLSPKD